MADPMPPVPMIAVVMMETSAPSEHSVLRALSRPGERFASAFDTDALAFGVPDRLLQCVDQELIPVSSFPGLPQPRSRQVEVGPNLLEHAPQVHVELGHRGPAPV